MSNNVSSNSSDKYFNDQLFTEKCLERIQTLIDQGKFVRNDFDQPVWEKLRSIHDDSTLLDGLFDQIERADLAGVQEKNLFLLNFIQQNETKLRKPGPDENILKSILDRTGYRIEVTAGQRKYGGPPPDGPERPSHHNEVFIGKLPREVFEDELIPLCEEFGKIWDLRLMIDPVSGYNKGYCFVTFCSQADSIKACERLNGYAIRPGKYIKANSSVANLRLFIGNIPKTKSKDEIRDELIKLVEGVVEVIVYAPADEVEKKKNRGFCFVDFDSHKNASAAKRKLSTGRVRLFNRDIAVDWADPDEEPDDETMSQVKVLYVRNLTSEVTENDVKQMFFPHGSIERVRKVRDYAFVHFEKREDALEAMKNLNGAILGRNEIEINLAKPMSEKRKQAQIKREQRKQFDPSFQNRNSSTQRTTNQNVRNDSTGRETNRNVSTRSNLSNNVQNQTSSINRINRNHPRTNQSSVYDRSRAPANAQFYVNEPTGQQIPNHFNPVYPINPLANAYHQTGHFQAAVNDPNSFIRSQQAMSFNNAGFPMNPIQQNQPYGGYIVFHHSPYAIGPVLACYAAAATATTSSYLASSVGENSKRQTHDEIEEKNRRSMVICGGSNSDSLWSEEN